jgi:hypothetical protein
MPKLISQLTPRFFHSSAGIFAVTVVGILIGLVCRADVCGIKTKMCRSKKSNRRQEATTDTVSRFEEIPLNTVNGKTNEGEG